jgi:hypothetical protein
MSGWRPFGNVIVDDIWPSGAGAVMSPACKRGPA